MNLKALNRLNQKKYRYKYEMTLIEGPRVISELEKTDFENCTIYYTEKYNNIETKFNAVQITEEQEKNISEVENSQGLIAAVPMSNYPTTRKNTHAIYLDHIQDPGNLGTIIRSAAWFGTFDILISDHSCDPFNPKVIRSSAGGIFTTPLIRNYNEERLIHDFKQIYAFDMSGEDLGKIHFDDNSCIVFGNEGNGLSNHFKESNDVIKVKIPGKANVESLNIGITASIAMNHIHTRLSE